MAVATREGERAARRGRGVSLKFVVFPLVVVAAAAAIAFAAPYVYAERALPGVTVAGVHIGSLDSAAIHERLDSELTQPWSERAVVAVHDGQTWRTTNGDLAVSPDVDTAIAAALAYGKNGTPIERAAAWLDALRGQAQIPLTLRAEGDALDRWVASLASGIERRAVSGEIGRSATGLTLTEPVVGRELDKIAATASVLAAPTLDDREIELHVRAIYPAVDDSGYRDAVARANAVITPLEVTVEDRRIAEDSAALATLLSIERVAARPGDLPALPVDAIAPSARYRYVVSLKQDRLKEWVTAVAAKLDRPAFSAKFTVNADGVASVIPGATGIRVTQDQLVAQLSADLLRPAVGTRNVAAPAAIDTPAFSTDQANSWLPKISRTSEFTTYYPPSAARHANISTGSSQFDGVVILPGQTFSFWELLGPVTVERGYAYAGAIINNRSDENVIGGGLCQVSTTMFNAVSKLGYEIVERHAHGYLIDRYPLGLDAAVFEPGVDFKWKNDTAAPVFLWSWNDATSVTFDVWSVPTGRTVVFSAPVQSRFVDVPADQPADPAFLPGAKVAGRDVVRTRTVYEGGNVVHQDTYYSHYAPVWGGPAPIAAP
ncbi:MAG TPA: VanW family protein [Candidatus Limnocylindria bacterium]|jgi:vancomycin resistance protein YoaR|nr:VanW family protein [Candidatus Limnocylindria bacterium]